jgi:hypothetical protein
VQLSPLKINLLLHIYAIAGPFDHPDRPIYEQTKEEFLYHELVVIDTSRKCGYRMTEKGDVFIKMILSTPLPEVLTKFIDPRTGEPV